MPRRLPPADPTLAALPAVAVRDEIRSINRQMKALTQRLARLTSELARREYDRKNRTYPTKSQYRIRPGSRPTYGRRPTLPALLARLLKGTTMTVPEAVEAVIEAGYRTKAATASDFRNQVQHILARPEFGRVRRGVYTAR